MRYVTHANNVNAMPYLLRQGKLHKNDNSIVGYLVSNDIEKSWTNGFLHNAYITFCILASC